MDKKNIHQRILAIMSEVVTIKKTEKKKGMQYNFISHDAVTSVLHPQFVKHGIAVFPNIREKHHDGNRCELVVEFTFVNADDPIDTVTASAVGYGIDSQDKGPGKAMSYAMKTALLKVFVLESAEPDNEDDQKTNHQPENKTKVEALSGPDGDIKTIIQKHLEEKKPGSATQQRNLLRKYAKECELPDLNNITTVEGLTGPEAEKIKGFIDLIQGQEDIPL